MNWDLIKPWAAQVARDFLRTAGTALAAHGFLQAGPGVEAFVGAGMTLAGLFWGWFTTSGYTQISDLLKRMTATSSHADAVKAAQVLPPAAAVDTQAKSVAVKAVTGVLLAAFVLSFLVLPGSAMAQPSRLPAATVAPSAPAPKPATTDPLQKLMDDITAKSAEFVTGVVAALQEADDDAGFLTIPSDPTSFRDPIAHACYPAQIKFLQSLPQIQAIKAPAPYNLIVLFQRKRDLIAEIKAGLPGYLKVGCAALLQDEATILTKTLGLIGVTIATGALTGIFPAAAPLTIPALTLPAL